MVQVKSSSGNFVSIQLIGVEKVRDKLKKLEMDIHSAKNDQLIKNATLYAREVQQSIMGARNETKSVDTGKFANSITITKKGKDEIVVEPRALRYTSGVNTQQVSTWLEYGTSKITPRRHFRNTAARIKPQVIDNFKKAVSQITARFK